MGRHEVGRPEPHRQWQPRPMQHCARRQEVCRPHVLHCHSRRRGSAKTSACSHREQRKPSGHRQAARYVRHASSSRNRAWNSFKDLGKSGRPISPHYPWWRSESTRYSITPLLCWGLVDSPADGAISASNRLQVPRWLSQKAPVSAGRLGIQPRRGQVLRQGQGTTSR